MAIKHSGLFKDGVSLLCVFFSSYFNAGIVTVCLVESQKKQEKRKIKTKLSRLNLAVQSSFVA